jgi:hypothetical protein
MPPAPGVGFGEPDWGFGGRGLTSAARPGTADPTEAGAQPSAREPPARPNRRAAHPTEGGKGEYPLFRWRGRGAKGPVGVENERVKRRSCRAPTPGFDERGVVTEAKTAQKRPLRGKAPPPHENAGAMPAIFILFFRFGGPNRLPSRQRTAFRTAFFCTRTAFVRNLRTAKALLLAPARSIALLPARQPAAPICCSQGRCFDAGHSPVLWRLRTSGGCFSVARIGTGFFPFWPG